MLVPSIEDQIRADPTNFAYMSGVLLGLFDGLRSYVDAQDRLGKPLDAQQVRFYSDRAIELHAIRQEALDALLQSESD